MKRSLLLLGLIGLCFVFPAFGQIPNAGFESWTSGNPVGWTTDNLVALNVVPITQVSTAHSGSSALKGAIVAYPIAGINYYAYLWTGYPYSQRSANFTGWYQLVPATGSKDSLYIMTYLYKSNNVIAYGGITATPSSSWKQFSVPLYHFSNAVPDSAWTWFILGNSVTSLSGTVGSYFLLDDLAYSGTATAVKEAAGVPINFALEQNYPNPFNPSTKINFSVAQAGHVTLKVFNLLGTEVASLVNEQKDAGAFSVSWNAAGLPSGMYLYRLSVTSQNGVSLRSDKETHAAKVTTFPGGHPENRHPLSNRGI